MVKKSSNSYSRHFNDWFVLTFQLTLQNISNSVQLCYMACKLVCNVVLFTAMPAARLAVSHAEALPGTTVPQLCHHTRGWAPYLWLQLRVLWGGSQSQDLLSHADSSGECPDSGVGNVLRNLMKFKKRPGKRNVKRHDYDSYWNCNTINTFAASYLNTHRR